MIIPTLTVLIAALASFAAAVPGPPPILVGKLPTKQQLIDTVNKSGSIGRKDCRLDRFAHRAVATLGRDFVRLHPNINCVVTGYPYTAKGPEVGLLAFQSRTLCEYNRIPMLINEF